MFIGERQNRSSWPEAGERLDGSIRLRYVLIKQINNRNIEKSSKIQNQPLNQEILEHDFKRATLMNWSSRSWKAVTWKAAFSAGLDILTADNSVSTPGVSQAEQLVLANETESILVAGESEYIYRRKKSIWNVLCR